MGGLEASAPVLQNWRGRGLTLSKWFFSEKIPFFQKVIKKYVEYLARTLKKIPPADLTQGGGAMQSLENKKAPLLLEQERGNISAGASTTVRKRRKLTRRI